MTNKLEEFSENVIEVFQIAEAYAKENMNAAIEPAHVLKALLHKDIGLVSFISWITSSIVPAKYVFPTP